jgi:hypothetical protein
MRRATLSVLSIFLLGSWTLTGRAAAAVRAANSDTDATVTFAKDVAPILYARCIGCHRAGEVVPMSLVTGSKVTVVTLFDNSAKNKYNPAPDKEVFWSEQSWDEMYAPRARITVDSRDLRGAKGSSEQPRDR